MERQGLNPLSDQIYSWFSILTRTNKQKVCFFFVLILFNNINNTGIW